MPNQSSKERSSEQFPLIKRIMDIPFLKGRFRVNFTNQPTCHNPYSDLDRFRKEAFIRVPGVVNFVTSDIEATLRANLSS